MALTRSGKSQEQVAERFWFPTDDSNWENGDLFRTRSVIKMSDLYQVKLDELLKGIRKNDEEIEKDTNSVKENQRLVWIGRLYLLLLLIRIH